MKRFRKHAAVNLVTIAKHRTIRFFRSRFGSLVARTVAVALLSVIFGAQAAYAGLTVTPNTWNITGLDSNNVSTGPDTFPVGVRVCNTGPALVTNVVANFIWDSANIYLNLTGPSTITVASLAGGACTDFYFNVLITRSAAAYDATRRYHINVSADGEGTVSTPTPREIYVEKLVSQNRNLTLSITGPSTVIVGRTYTFIVTAKTAPGGYEQLENFLTLPNSMFQILAVSSTYTSPAGGTNNQLYADACGWDNNPLSATYRSCIGPTNYTGGKAGGDITTTYTVKVVAAGTATLRSVVHDFSGSSYHYNSDYDSDTFAVTALRPPIVTLAKSVTPSGTVEPGTDLVYSITFTNEGDTSANSLIITDPIPTNTDFKVGSAGANLGTTGLTVTITYSNNGGAAYTYTPVGGGGGAPAGYDRNVTHVRWAFAGNLGAAAPNDTGSVTFTVRVR